MGVYARSTRTMAASFATSSDITCNFCNSRYRDPKILPCLHVYCRDCIDKLRVACRPGVIRCPECSQDVALAEEDSESLPDALHVYHKLGLRRFAEKLEASELTCGPCFGKNPRKSVEARAFCTQCAQHLCAGCVARHSAPDGEVEFSGHELVTFQDLTVSSQHGDTSKHLAVVKRQRAATFSSRFAQCEAHPGKELTHYCLNCNRRICNTCQLDQHRGHVHKHYSRAASDIKREVEESLPSIRILHKRMAASVYDLKKARKEVETQGKHLSESIDSSFERLTTILERRREELQKLLAQKVEEKCLQLAWQKKELRQGEEELGRMEFLMEENVEMCTEQEMLLMFKFLHDRIKETTQRYSNIKVEPCESPNLALSVTTCAQQISDACQKHAKLYTLEANPLACEVEGAGLLSAEVNRKAQFTVHAQNRIRAPCSSPQDVTVSVKCLSNELTFDADVHERGQSTYLVSYYPEHRGMYELSVLVNGEPVQGSPFSVRVTYPPSLLGKSQGIINDVKEPRGIIVKPGGGFFVTEWSGHQVVELDKFGRRVKCFGAGVLQHPASVTMDVSGHLYVVDSAGERSCIVKINPDGEAVSVVGSEGGAVFNNPRGVALSRKNELYVCDRDNHRIQVFDSNLQFLHYLDLKLSDPLLRIAIKPNDVAFDNAGKMYIADCANNCILSFTSSNYYLGLFGTEGEGVGKLGAPECVHVNNGLVYVTEYHEHRVSVFRINGDFVTSFGTLGSQADQLQFPTGITIDDNGIVYVCEFFNNRIQLF